jgi:hypothetical protein
MGADFGGRLQARLGSVIDVLACSGLAAPDGKRVGIVTFTVDGRDVEAPLESGPEAGQRRLTTPRPSSASGRSLPTAWAYADRWGGDLGRNTIRSPTIPGERKTMGSVRTPEEVFQHHGDALAKQDIDAIISDYAEDAIAITPAGVLHGRQEIGDAIRQVLATMPNASWDMRLTIFERDVLFLLWGAESEQNRINDCVDTFLFRDGLIVTHTMSFTVTPIS